MTEEKPYLVMDDTNCHLDPKDAPKPSREDEERLEKDLERIFEKHFGKPRKRP